MRIVVIGATGHIGTALIPRLVAQGAEVVAVSRGQSEPYQERGEWRAVQQVTLDRQVAEQAGEFGREILALKPDAVIDLICFTPESNQQLVAALRGQVQHFLHCGTIFVHGHSEVVPTLESAPRRPPDQYGIGKAAIERDLLREARQNGFPATILHPGHIVGVGWNPINPAGNLNLEVFRTLARGEPLALPNLGMETLHHVHADDVAQGFEQALTHWNAAFGEAFHIVSPAAVTLRGYAEAAARWFGQEARLSFLPFGEWRQQVSDDDAEKTLEHIARSPNCSIEKARRALAYAPRYTTFQAVRESLNALIQAG